LEGLPLTGSLLPRSVTSVSGDQFADRFMAVPFGAFPRWYGIGRDGAAIVLPPLNFERGQAMVRRCRQAACFRQSMKCLVTLRSIPGVAGADAAAEV
jgi:hypothetical protein